MSDLFNVSSNPHIRSKITTKNIMLDVIIALFPASIFGVYNFGLEALITIITCITTCVITEWTYEHFMKKKSTITDLSAVVTGLLLALNLPSSVPIWIPVIGGVFAILIIKQLFGGIGQNIINPALGARCFLLISFTGRMTTYSYDGVSTVTSINYDAITTATPLAELKAGKLVNVWDMVIGRIPGTIGETSAIALLIGGIYLIVRKIINYRIPVIYLVTFMIFILIFSGRGFDSNFLGGQLFGGGLFLGAFFMATDYTTSPMTGKGQIVFAVILGILTGLFRLFAGSPGGASYAIIIANLLVPLIDKYTLPTPFGKGGKKKHE